MCDFVCGFNRLLYEALVSNSSAYLCPPSMIRYDVEQVLSCYTLTAVIRRASLSRGEGDE